MTAIDLLKLLNEQGITLSVDGVDLRISAPKGAMNEELRQLIIELKTELLDLLTTTQNPEIEAFEIISRKDELALSFAQQRLWFLDQLDPGLSIYNIPSALKLSGPLDLDRLQDAVNQLIQRHEVFRSKFITVNRKPVVKIDKNITVRLQKNYASRISESELNKLLSSLNDIPFDLGQTPLLRVHCVKLSDEAHILLLIVHHIIADGESLVIALEELAAGYANQSNLTSKIQYLDFAAWQRKLLTGKEEKRQLKYWQELLIDAPPLLDIPADYPRPSKPSNRGGWIQKLISKDLRNQLNEIARAEKSTLYMVTLAAFKVLLMRWTQEEDLVIGTPVAGRHHNGTQKIIGLFINSLVIRSNVQPTQSFKAYLKQINQLSLDVLEHQDLPFERLVEKLNIKRDTSYSPVFQVFFNFQNREKELVPFEKLEVSPVVVETGTAKFDLSILIEDRSDGLSVWFEYSKDLFKPSSIKRMSNHFEVLLNGIINDPDRIIGQLPILTNSETNQIVSTWNDTGVDYKNDGTMHSSFEKMAESFPEKEAIWSVKEALTYRELNRRANKLAAKLRHLGIGPEVLVALCTERCNEMIVAMLAILKAGGAYVPVDPLYPKQRVSHMLQDSEASVLITQSSLMNKLPETKATKIYLDNFDWSTNKSQDKNFKNEVIGKNLGYTIYTSGSTGLPKGVEIEHRNAVALINWSKQTFSKNEFSGVLASTSICFDLSVFEIFCPLSAGGRIVLVENALSLATLPQEANVTLINTVPSAIAELLRIEGIPISVKTVNLAGEPLTTELVNKIYDLRNINNVNDLYGPSEDTTYSTWTRREVDVSPTIGRPIDNTQVYLLDSFGQPVPVGVAGEMYLGGSGVTRGYRNHPTLTAEKYVVNPFNKKSKARLFRTGDQAKYREDGNLEFIGRLDHQIKLRGFRIELGEIETALRKEPNIDDVVVIIREDTLDDKRIVAYHVGDASAKLLRQNLIQKLPEYMVPSAFVELESLPLTPNGKIDRNALPRPDWRELNTTEYVAPRTPIEETLVEIWKELLNVEKVGVHDDFFMLGGHSLLGTQLIARIRDTLNNDLALRALFESPTISGIAAAMQKNYVADLPKLTSKKTTTSPLAPAQQRIWILEQLEPGNSVYNIPLALRLKGEVNQDALQEAINLLVTRHQTLRSKFVIEANKPKQKISSGQKINLKIFDFGNQDKNKLKKKLTELARKPFQLEAGPLFRVNLIHLNGTEKILQIVIHHIIAVGWSIDILLREIAQDYSTIINNKPSTIEKLKIQYFDYARWQNSCMKTKSLGKQLEYWKKSLLGAEPIIELPIDHPRPAIQTYAGAWYEIKIPVALAQSLKELSQKQNSSFFMILLASFKILLARDTGQQDLVIGTPIAGRQRIELESVIGLFINTLAIRTDLNGNPKFSEVLKRVKESSLGAFSNQDYPFEKLVEELQPNRDTSYSPIFQVMFSLQNTSASSSKFSEIESEPVLFEFGNSKFDLTLAVEENEKNVSAYFEYSTDLFDALTIKNMADRWKLLLEQIARNPEKSLYDFELLSPNDRKRILYDWNETSRKIDQGFTLHESFYRQVKKTPNATAVITDSSELSYLVLNQRANQLANYLIQLGAGKGSIIGVSLERSDDMLVALLGVIKSGAAYLPLDPDFPSNRLQYMLEDSGAKILVTQEKLDLIANKSNLSIVRIDSDKKLKKQNNSNPNINCSGEELAYVIYTSGSTGKPKGVAIEHCSVVNFIRSMIVKPGLSDHDRLLAVTTLSFDISILELFGPLLAGGATVIARKSITSDGFALTKAISHYNITVMQATPATWRLMLQAGWQGSKNLKILCGGEA
ncbi:MAG: amino acid adenylation domain-containing protein, partial [Pseudomonadota bacterium]|nr:amino acid adenylation domain-containing protein [Pseudomonadota bacterium]